MASNKIENLKDIVVDGLAGSVKTYLPILNRPPCRHYDWLSADLIMAVTDLTLLGLD